MNFKVSIPFHKYYPIIYILLIVGIALSYIPAKSVMILQTAWIWIMSSTVTLNFVILFFLYGLVCDKYTKNMSKRKAWIIWIVGMLVLVVLLRILGMSTIFG